MCRPPTARAGGPAEDTGGQDRDGDGSAEADDGADVERGGYRQELKRTLGSFQVFAISFAFISVAVGVFGTYDEVLRTAGPVGIWLWLIAAAGQTLVADFGAWSCRSRSARWSGRCSRCSSS
ncbi:hypothetical protein [Streptomyces sp. DSM 40907]|uniref:hypothetical protein n=1 Tax=Streptomyces kutzneri TaxID=3051179 RepID=UPI0028D42DDA|nr:hypothetical protein [Streptomyces sp. DSM 40907]